MRYTAPRMLVLRLVACGIAIVAMVGEGIRSWGIGRPIAFWMDDVILGSLLLIGAWVTGRETPRRRAFFSGAWGVAAGMAYLSFFQKVFDPVHQNAGNLSLGLLTVLAGAGLVLTVAGLIASVALPQPSIDSKLAGGR